MNRKFCSHDCYVRSRHSKSQGSVVAQEEERNIGWLSQARSTIEDTGMSEKQKHRYRTLSKTYPKAARAHRIVEALDIFYACTTVADASKRFKELYSWMRRCRLEPMKNAAVTLMNHRKEIMNYFHDRLTNAICEGINSLVQAAKRKARGFNTFEGFKAMIFLVAGKLELDAPAPF